MPEAPNIRAISVLMVTGVALVLFTRDRIPPETSGFLVQVALTRGK